MNCQFSTKPLRDLIKENPKSTLKVRDSLDTGRFIFLTSGTKTRYSNDYLCEEENLFLATGGTAHVGYFNGPAAYSTDCYSITTKEGLSTKLLYYFLLSQLNYINESLFRGAALKHLQKRAFKELPVPVPPEVLQERIVAILDEAFAGIATAVANAEKNLPNARELWAGALASACSGALTKGWRPKNSEIEPAKDLLLRAIARRHEQRRTSGRPKEPQPPIAATKTTIPDTWVWASPEQLSTHIVDCPHSTPRWADEGPICIRTTNFRPGYLDLGSVRYVSEVAYTERARRLEPKPGDVLYSREGGILGIACTFPDGLKACLGQRMMLFRLDNCAVHPRYFACVLNSPHILTIVNRLTAGAAAPHINIRDIRTFPIPLPPFSEQQQIVTVLDTVWTSIQRLERIQLRKLDFLAELKQSILQKAFSGELTAKPDKALAEAGL